MCSYFNTIDSTCNHHSLSLLNPYTYTIQDFIINSWNVCIDRKYFSQLDWTSHLSVFLCLWLFWRLSSSSGQGGSQGAFQEHPYSLKSGFLPSHPPLRSFHLLPGSCPPNNLHHLPKERVTLKSQGTLSISQGNLLTQTNYYCYLFKCTFVFYTYFAIANNILVSGK